MGGNPFQKILLLFQLFRQIINHLYEISTLLTLSEDVILHSLVKLLGFRDGLFVQGLKAHSREALLAYCWRLTS